MPRSSPAWHKLLFVRSPQKTQHRVRLVESLFDARLILRVLGFVVGQNYDCAARIGAAFSLQIIGCVHKRARNARPSVETLGSQQGVQFVTDLPVVRFERESQAGVRVENHNGNSISRRKNAERRFRGIRDPLNVRLHAPTHV
jgi:hypothetical protein